MFKNKLKKKNPTISETEKNRRKREIIIICAVVMIIFLLTFAENQMIHLGGDFPVSNAILVFILINVNLLLLLLLIFLVIRNLVKLIYDRRRKVMGARLRTRLVMAFIGLTLLPTSVLFFFSINFITNSIEFWFSVPVEQALENSLRVGRRVYSLINTQNQFYIERIAYQIKTKKMLDIRNRKTLHNYIQVVQREFNIQAVEVYEVSRGRTMFNRIAFAAGELKAEQAPPLDLDALNRAPGAGRVWSISENLPSGELVRTVGTVPAGESLKTAEAFVVLAVLISPGLTENLASISRGAEEYKQIKMLKGPIQLTYYLTMLIVALLLMFCAIWFGFRLSKTLTIPINQLAEGTRRVADGDLEFSIGLVGDDEMGSLVDSFNKMTRDLRISREQLEASALKLKEQNTEIEARRRYMEIVLNNVSTGVISLDADGLVSTINKSAERMLGMDSASILRKHYTRLLEDQPFDIAGKVMEHLGDSDDGTVEFPLKATIGGSPRSFVIRANRLKDDAGRGVGLVMVFDDLTELEKAQRMAAWREVARRIAHEVKNPLTPIKLSAQRLKRKYSSRLDEPVFEECTQMIIDHVDLIRNLVNEFSTYARFPASDPRPCPITPIIEETMALFREGHRHIHFEQDLPQTPVVLKIDRHQIKQALINLVTNAVSAIKTQQGVIRITLSADAKTRVARLEISDNGTGISDEEKLHLFEPYFSTKTKGMGLGLSIVNSIISDHNGKITVQDNIPNGAMFIIELPMADSPNPVEQDDLKSATDTSNVIETEVNIKHAAGV